jgi:hypothetical protein
MIRAKGNREHAAVVSPLVAGAFLVTDFLALMRLAFTLSFRRDKSYLSRQNSTKWARTVSGWPRHLLIAMGPSRWTKALGFQRAGGIF